MKRCYILFFLLTIGISAIFAQRTITGKVTDSGNDPIIGANIVVKELPNVGTISDVDGMYSITVPKGGTVLVFTYTGYESFEFVIGNSNTVDVKCQMHLTSCVVSNQWFTCVT